MQKLRFLYCFLIAGLLLFAHCKKAYEPEILKNSKQYLVVNGFINTNQGAVTSIYLSRTVSIYDTTINAPEKNAAVSIESSTGDVEQLSESGSEGEYRSNPLFLNTSGTYRLNIRTSDGIQYQSEFVANTPNPSIDSISWIQDVDLKLFVSTHDPANSTWYYRWDFVETYEYHAQLESQWILNNNLIDLADTNTQKSVCYKSKSSTDINIGTSIALNQDLISMQQLYVIPKDDPRLAFRYSFLVNQYTLTQEAYQYWQIVQKNSQELGGLFDQLPSQLIGNIHCLTNPNDPVLGFASVSGLQQKRIFIKNIELDSWPYLPPKDECAVISTYQNPVSYRIWDFPDPEYAPWYFTTGGGMMVAKKICLDCTLWGGSNQKPSFWQ
jgi:hypothetical protein